MAINQQKFLNFVNHIPGLVLLGFSMLVLHSSLNLMESNKNLLNAYKNYSRDILSLEGSYYAFKSNFWAYLSGSAEIDEDVLVKNFTHFADVHQKTLMNAYNLGRQPENYIKQLLDIQSQMAGIMVAINNKDQLSTDASQGILTAALDSIHESLQELGESFYSEEQEMYMSAEMLGRERWLYWSVLAIGFSGFILVVLNSDKLKKLKRADFERKGAMALLENRLAAMEASRDGIALVDAKGNLTYMNQALMKLHNIPEGKYYDYINQPWENLYAKKTAEVQKGRIKIQEIAVPALEKTGYWRGESPIAEKDGEIVNAELSLTLLPDGGFIGTVRDISERKKNENEKKELQDQFYQAQKMEAVGRLAGGIAHDFNNILAAMNGYAEFLTDDLEDGSPQHKFALNILQAGQQARDLVDQMLAFSRRKESAKDVFDLTIPVHETLSMLKATLPKTIDVNAQIDAPHAPIHGNASQIAQVIMNLCVNAKDAIEDEHGSLRIGLDIIKSNEFEVPAMLTDELPDASEVPPVRFDEPEPGRTRLILGQLVRDQKYVCLSVEDTGCGMSQVIMEHIFEPFFTTKPVDKGTGLGLATVHGVVTSHQGAMVIDSTLGKGTCFDILFPVAEGAIKEDVADQSVAGLERGSGRILLVEDQDSVRDMMTNMLVRLGFEAQPCESAMEALDFIRENPEAVDLVLTDYNMPKMTGLELAQQVHLDFPDVPFIVVSGYSEKKMRDIIENHPAIKAVLKKPVSKQVLAQKIKAVLSGQQMAA